MRRHYLVVPRHSLSSYGRRAFAVAGPTAWMWTHIAMICVIRRLALTVSDICLKLGCFQSTSTHSALEVAHFMRYINPRLTYSLTSYRSSRNSIPSLLMALMVSAAIAMNKYACVNDVYLAVHCDQQGRFWLQQFGVASVVATSVLGRGMQQFRMT